MPLQLLNSFFDNIVKFFGILGEVIPDRDFSFTESFC